MLREAEQSPSLHALLTEAAALDERVDSIAQSEGHRRLPLGAVAALSDANDCVERCERFVLRRRHRMRPRRSTGIFSGLFSKSCCDIVEDSIPLTPGVIISDIGKSLENKGYTVERIFDATLEQISAFLAEKKDVIVVVDGGELLGDREEEKHEDKFIGEIPDHTVVVTAVSLEHDFVEIFDPSSTQQRDRYSVEQFLDAWADSCNYLVVIYD